jgi:hypothetical protein
MQYGALCACHTRKQAPYNRTPVPGGPLALGRKGFSDRSLKPSADRPWSQALQINKGKVGQTTSSYHQQVLDKAVAYLCSC